MPPRCSIIQGTLTPFLYPSLLCSSTQSSARKCLRKSLRLLDRRCQHTHRDHSSDGLPASRLNPPPEDYSRPVFTDRATITVGAGSGGHGCISFVREKYIPAGPANGGSGGSGGNVYIQAVHGETSLHKLARRGTIVAGRGRNGQGKGKGGVRGEDVVVQVPVGTIVREIERIDPVAMEEDRIQSEIMAQDDDADGPKHARPYKWSREKWVLYPAITPEDIATAEFPKLPRARKSPLAMSQVPAPVQLDLSEPMETPLLLAAGAVGGLGNPHFVTKEVPRPKYATKGETGLKITLELELKLLADVGLVGLPNAGKSTLLRALSNSRARVGNWAFTTLQPNIGTVVLDDHKGRPLVSSMKDGKQRTNFTIADIPGLLPDAHLDRGLGISFLRHVERARVLAFVIDLGAGDAVEALKALWKEVSLYEEMKVEEDEEKSEKLVEWQPFQSVDDALENRQETIVISSSNGYNPSTGGRFPNKPEVLSIADKCWFVVATKADLSDTQENFQKLKTYLEEVEKGDAVHPSGREEAWRKKVVVVPVSAINGHGVERITEWTVQLLDDNL